MSDGLVSSAQRLDPARLKFALEIGEQRGEVRRRADFAKVRPRPKDLLHLLKVGWVVGSKVNGPAGCESLPGQGGEPVIDQSVSPMAALRPGVGEIKVQGGGGVGWQQVFEEIAGFEADAAQVGQARLPPLAVELPNSSQEPFHTDTIAFGVAAGVLDKEGAIPTAQLDFQGLDAGKQLRQINPFEDGPQFVDEA